jgi:hypothetical protein
MGRRLTDEDKQKGKNFRKERGEKLRQFALKELVTDGRQTGRVREVDSARQVLVVDIVLLTRTPPKRWKPTGRQEDWGPDLLTKVAE